MRLSIRIGFAVALTTGTVGATGAMAAPVVSAAASNEAASLALLDQSAAAYARLEGLSMRFACFIQEGDAVSRNAGTIAFTKLGAVRVTTSFSSIPIIQAAPPENAKVGVGRAMQEVDFGDGPLAKLVQGENPFRQTPEGIGWKNIRLLPDNGVVATARFSSSMQPNGYDVTLSIYLDPLDNLLRRVEVKALVKGKMSRYLTSFSDVQLNPQFAPDTFVAPLAPTPAPPPKVTPARGPNIYWDPKIKVGTAPYALQGVNIARYKGKVVLLDFWATWCGPCVGEMPSVLKNYAKFHPKGFEVVGISLDESKKDLTDFVKARHVPWQQVYDGKGWKGVNVARYGVQGIPFTLLVGRDGKIAAVNPRGAALEPAIKKALAK